MNALIYFAANDRISEGVPQVARMLSTDEQRQRTSSGATGHPLRIGSSPVLRRMPFFSDISGMGASDSSRINIRKKSHYYRIKVLPALTGGKGIKLEVTLFVLFICFVRFSFPESNLK